MDIVTLPEGYRLFKGMPKASYTVRDVRNLAANHIAWFGSREVATTYSQERNGMVYEFIALRPLKLLVLGNTENLEYVDDRIEDPEQRLYFRATTGYKMTVDEQEAFFRHMVGRVRNNLRRRPGEPPKGYHRVSVSTYADTQMATAICAATGLDGYIAYETPTFLYNQLYPLETIQEEICLCSQRSAIEFVFGETIPDALGYSSYLVFEDHFVHKYLMPNSNSAATFEAEIVASQQLAKHSHLFVTYTSTDAIDLRLTSPRQREDAESWLLREYETVTRADLQGLLDSAEAVFSVLDEERILHWDAVPRNFLIDVDGAFRLSDFGTTRVLDHNYLTLQLTPNLEQQFNMQVDRKTFYVWLLCYAVAFRRVSPAWQWLYKYCVDILKPDNETLRAIPQDLHKQQAFIRETLLKTSWLRQRPKIV